MRLGHGSLEARAALALGAVLTAFATACGGSGSSGGGAGTDSGFSAQLLPAQIDPAGGGHGDVLFTGSGNALVVGGDSDDIRRVARADGAVTLSTGGVGAGMGGGNLVSLADPPSSVLYAGDDLGQIWEVQGGASSLLVDVGTGPINAMQIAPEGYGSFAGQIIVASEAEGLLAVNPQSVPVAQTPITADPFSDLVFEGTTLYAADHANGEIATVAADGTVTTFTSDLSQPDGLALDTENGQLFVADAGDDRLRSVSLATTTVTDLGAYDFAAGPLPTGMAFDGERNLLFLTPGSLVLRGVGVPGFDAGDFPVSIVGSNAGFGALALDRRGDLLGTANGAASNRVFRIPRDGGEPTTVASDLGAPVGGELLFGIAHDAATETTFVGTSDGRIFALNAGGSSVFATLAGGAEAVLGLALAPDTFTPFGGDLVAGTDAGKLWAIDIGTGAAIDFATVSGGAFSDLAFAADGTLYVADSGNAEVIRVDSAGATTVVTGALPAPDGLALDEGGSRLLVTDALDDELVAVALPGGVPTTLASFAFNSLGAAPSGIAFDGLGSVLLMTGNAAATVRHQTVFP